MRDGLSEGKDDPRLRETEHRRPYPDVREERPAESGGTRRENRYPQQQDVDETVAWCDECAAESRFIKRDVDVSTEEENADMPNVGQALEGEIGWVCQECGGFHRDLIQEEGYNWEYSDVGYHVSQFDDEEETVRPAQEESATPPERIHGLLESKGPEDTGETAEWEVADDETDPDDT